MSRVKYNLVLLVALLFCLQAVASPSQGLPLNTKLVVATTFKAQAKTNSFTLTWKYTKPTSQTLRHQQLVISGPGLKRVLRLAATTRTISVKNLNSGFTYSVTWRAITTKAQSKPVTTRVSLPRASKSNVIYFEQPADMYVDSPPQSLAARAPSGAVTFSSQSPAVCSVVASEVRPLKAGWCIVRATAPANPAYVTAAPVERTIMIVNRPAEPQRVLLWSDEFDGTGGASPNSASWTADIGDGCAAPHNNCGWGNTERQWYRAENHVVDAQTGILSINANRTTPNANLNCYYGKCEWTSGKITTYNKVSFTYGYMEARIKASPGVGTWPAFWMLGTNIRTTPWPFCGELDIFEYKGYQPNITFGTIHFANSANRHTYLGGIKDMLVDLSADYHRYGMLWLEDEISFFVDDQLVYNVNKSATGLTHWPFGKNAQGKDPEFYAILNLAMGGHFGGNIDPQLSSSSLKVDWVRYYSVDGVGKVTLNK
jgi:beta-glucanase (GH16 family)